MNMSQPRIEVVPALLRTRIPVYKFFFYCIFIGRYGMINNGAFIFVVVVVLVFNRYVLNKTV